MTGSPPKFTQSLHSILKVWTPPPPLTISQWADEHGVLTAETSAEPGKWRPYAYQIAMMDAFCVPEVERITIMKSARVGYTRILGHVMAYHIHQDPCPILVIQPTDQDAEDYSKEEIQPMINATPPLLELIGDGKSRSAANTIRKKQYPGGTLTIGGANAPRNFRRLTCRLVLFDEVDGYPAAAGIEGDQIKLGTARAETYWNRKIALGSTPTVKGISRIGDSYRNSDGGYFFLACPECGADHVRVFSEPDEPLMMGDEQLPASWLHWEEGNPESAKWVCPVCGVLIGHKHHHNMVDNGHWRGPNWRWDRRRGFQVEPEFSGHIGFRIWAGYGYSPNSTPAKMAARFIEDSQDTEALKTFVNTILGEEWEERGEAASATLLQLRAKSWGEQLPAGVLILTAGVDIQADRIELEVCGWGIGEESWSIDYLTLPGDTAQPEVWEDLETALAVEYRRPGGAAVRISGAGVDSSYLTGTVKKFVEGKRRRGWYALRGMAGENRPIIESVTVRARRQRQRKTAKPKPELIGVDEAKIIIMRRLRLTEPGPGFCHFPADRPAEYFEQLTAEKYVRTKIKGKEIREWRKTRRRNEALDCRVYAFATLRLLEPQWKKLADRAAGHAKTATARPKKSKPPPPRRPMTR